MFNVNRGQSQALSLKWPPDNTRPCHTRRSVMVQQELTIGHYVHVCHLRFTVKSNEIWMMSKARLSVTDAKSFIKKN